MPLAPPSPAPRCATTRRRLLAGTAGLALLAGCGRGGSGSSGAPAAASWTFTDDRGVTVERPARPARIAAYTAPGAALLSFGVRPVAVFGTTPLIDPLLDGFDTSGIESAGESYGVVDLETLLALGVDLIVTAFDPDQEGPVFGFTDLAAQQQTERIAPVVAFNGVADPGEVIRRFGELAAALGADLEAPDVAATRQRYDAAREAVREAAAAKAGLVAVSVLASPADGIYFWRPDANPHTRQLQELGLAFAQPQSPPADVNEDFYGALAEVVGLEEAGRQPADLILLDRTDPAVMADVPTWAALPAVQAGQFAPCDALIRWTYAQQAEELEGIAAAVAAADPNLV